MSKEFTVADHTYKAGKLDAFKQFHIARRLTPVLSGLAGAANVVKDGDEYAALEPLVNAVASLPDADADYIINTCLDVVQREQDGGKGWARVRSSSGVLMFDDIDAVVLLHITWSVLQHNLGGFSHALRQLSNGTGLMSKASNG